MAKPAPTSAQLGKAIRLLRKQRGLSIEKLAQKADITVSYVSDIQRGIRNPTWEMIRKIAEALDIDTPALIGMAETIAQADRRRANREKKKAQAKKKTQAK